MSVQVQFLPALTPRKSAPLPTELEARWARVRVAEETYFLPLPEIEPRFLDHLVPSLTVATSSLVSLETRV